jgi:hypothetical protein
MIYEQLDTDQKRELTELVWLSVGLHHGCHRNGAIYSELGSRETCPHCTRAK